MGCDIHSVAQVQEDGKWKTVEVRVAGDDRNYDSFAVLADVRNGSGFAGVKTGEGWDYIAEPRGLPDDFVRGYYDEDAEDKPPFREDEEGEYHPHPHIAFYWNFDNEKKDPRYYTWMGEHSHSHFTLKELEDFEQKLSGEKKDYMITGVITRDQYEELKGGTMPEHWAGWTSGPDIKVVTQLELEAAKVPMEYTHVHASWPSPIKERLWMFYKYIDRLQAIAKEHSKTHEEVRLVFGFDS